MARVDLNKIRLGYSPLSDSIYLYRHGKDEKVALDKRPAEKDVLYALTQMMMNNAPKGSIKTYSFGGQWYQVIVKPAKKH